MTKSIDYNKDKFVFTKKYASKWSKNHSLSDQYKDNNGLTKDNVEKSKKKLEGVSSDKHDIIKEMKKISDTFSSLKEQLNYYTEDNQDGSLSISLFDNTNDTLKSSIPTEEQTEFTSTPQDEEAGEKYIPTEKDLEPSNEYENWEIN